MGTKLYKILQPGGLPAHGGTGQWSLPTRNEDGTWTPGKWMPNVTRIKVCSRGYHVVDLAHMIEWCGDWFIEIYEVEVKGKSDLSGYNKQCWSQARLLRGVLSLSDTLNLSADFAEHVLPIFLKALPNDTRPAKAIEAKRLWASKVNIARAAAWAAAGAAAGDAAWDAARAAARDAARDAAWDAAWDAAGDAAGDAAWDAARAAAWAAARAAAGDAAGDAAWAAARDAAGDAETEWQLGKIAEYLTANG